MGATRESSWSDEIFGACPCGEDCHIGEASATYARLSPGTNAAVQSITTRNRKIATCRFGFMDLLSALHATATNPLLNRQQTHGARSDHHSAISRSFIVVEIQRHATTC